MKKYFLYLSITLVFATCAFGRSAEAGTITGTITYKGKKPKLRKINMAGDPICLTKHDAPVSPQTITLGPNFEMKNAFVRVIQGLPNKSWPTPSEPVVLDQEGCMYNPPVFGVMINQPVEILNPDGTLHNVHALSKKNPEFNIAMPKFRKKITKTFEKEEFMFEIKCDVHPWMVTFASVLSHPFFDTTDEKGVYEIKDLPPGEYVIEAWHQRLAPQTAKVTVTEGEAAVVDFTFQRPDGK